MQGYLHNRDELVVSLWSFDMDYYAVSEIESIGETPTRMCLSSDMCSHVKCSRVVGVVLVVQCFNRTCSAALATISKDIIAQLQRSGSKLISYW